MHKIKVTKLYKCIYCKELIETEELHAEVIKDKNGNEKLFKNGNFQTRKSHIKCREAHLNSVESWNRLMKYLEQTYFNIIAPKAICVRMRELIQRVDTNTVYECLVNLEANLAIGMSKIEFKSDTQKANYIMVALQNNINGFALKKKFRLPDMQAIENITLLDRKDEKKDSTQIDYDILE